MELISTLHKLGFDTDTLERLGGNIDLYCSLCIRFLEDKTFDNIHKNKGYIDSQQNQPLHTLKGLAANLGFRKLRDIAEECQLNLKQNNLSSFYENIEQLEIEYNRIIAIIKEYIVPYYK